MHPVETRNWNRYFDAAADDTPHRHVVDLLRNLQTHYKISILSGRSMSTIKITMAWLKKHQVPYHHLQMRPVENREQDDTLKIKWARELNLTPANVAFVLEDRQRVVAAWRRAGFNCFQVASGDF